MCVCVCVCVSLLFFFFFFKKIKISLQQRLLRVWVRLSFYWGAAALWPKCVYGRGDSASTGEATGNSHACQEPLLARPRTSAANSITCTFYRNGVLCKGPAVYCCDRYGHSAICAMCLQKKQAAMMGAPGPGASTDVYDALVERETDRPEGQVYILSELECRKPPKIAPNWKKTYRLQQAVLVAVVRLGASCQPLSREQPIQWAEVVTSDKHQPFGEAHFRSERRMALRLLTRGDCSSLLPEHEAPLEVGSRVAVIDLRVFVPEVVSVLATLANSSFANSLQQIPFVNRFIGVADDQNSSTTTTTTITTTTTMAIDLTKRTQQIILEAVNASEIEIIKRLVPMVKEQVANDIARLPIIRTLYGTQLAAFAGALSSAVHCTQGPPGTGKVCSEICTAVGACPFIWSCAFMVCRSAKLYSGYIKRPRIAE